MKCILEFCNTVNIFYIPIPFYATKIIDPFLNSMISANHDRVEGHSANAMVKFLQWGLKLNTLFSCSNQFKVNKSSIIKWGISTSFCVKDVEMPFPLEIEKKDQN